jgi:uncharacterized RDD family membrane protein YckC
MKCPKCGYLGFEQAERCRNCGYDFALTTTRVTPDLSLRDAEPDIRAFEDLDLIDAAAPQPGANRSASAVQLATAVGASAGAAADVGELPLFDDVPLITKPSPPRPPLAVRRATPELPRLRSEPARTAPFEFQEAELEMPLDAPVSPAVRASASEWFAASPGTEQLAGLGARFLAAAIDLALLALVDVGVVYLTVQICGLAPNELSQLPLGPLIAFLIVQNGGYLVAFTAGGQTIGKMLVGIRVVMASRGESLDLGRSLVRTLVWSVMALPVGLGLLTALFSSERRGFHDRLAGTKVIRAVAA